MKKALRISGWVLVALIAVYYVGVNVLLGTSLGERLFTSKPEQFQIRYQRAWSLIPGRVQVRGFQLSTQDRSVQLMITADRVHGNLHPWTLWELRFFATDVEAEGVTLSVRPRVKEAEVRDAHLDELPPIAGFDSPLLTAEEEAQPKGPVVTVQLEGLTVRHLREVWIDRVRYTGDGELTGGMLYVPKSRLRLDDVRFTDANSKLTLAGYEVPVEQLDAAVALRDVELSGLELAAFRQLSADVKAKATIDPRFLNDYLRNVRGLASFKASGVPGALELEVKIKEGVVADGSVLSYETPRAAVRIPFVEVSGAAAVKGVAEKGRLSLDVQLRKAKLERSDGERLAEADRFGVIGSSDVDLTKLDSVDARLVLSGGRVPSLSALNDFIPEGVGVRLADGRGEAEGKLSLDSSSARGKGEFDLTASDVVVQNRSARVSGKLKVHGEVRSIDLNTGAVDFSGSTVAIEDATLRAQTQSWPVWVRLVADPCVVKPKAKEKWSTTLSLGASNLQPLLAIVSANVSLPRALGLFTNSPNVKLEAQVKVRDDGVDMPKLTLTSAQVRAHGAVALRPVSESEEKLQPWGSVLVQAGVFSAGVELEGSKIKLVLFNLERWAAGKNLSLPVEP